METTVYWNEINLYLSWHKNLAHVCHHHLSPIEYARAWTPKLSDSEKAPMMKSHIKPKKVGR